MQGQCILSEIVMQWVKCLLRPVLPAGDCLALANVLASQLHREDSFDRSGSDLLCGFGQLWVDLAHQLHARNLLYSIELLFALSGRDGEQQPRPVLASCSGMPELGLGQAHLGFTWLCAGPVMCCCAQLSHVAERCLRCISTVCWLPTARIPC